MLRKNDFLLQLRCRSYDLEKLIEQKTKHLKNAPEGKLRIINKGSFYQYYFRQRGEKEGGYLRKDNMEKIYAYARNDYDRAVIAAAVKEQKLIDTFLDKYEEPFLKIYDKYPDELKKILNPADITDEEYARRWEAKPYKGKPFDEGEPVHLTPHGLRVRSKSEVLIIGVLEKLDIPYRYECPLKLSSGEIVHPDFTLLNKKTREVVYYEHLGKMDEMGYVAYNLGRLKKMEDSGIYLGKNFIITYETKADPLNSGKVERMLMSFFG